MIIASPDRLLEGCFRIPHDAPPKWLFVLTAYVDESGQEQDDWMFMAGYYGTDAAWQCVAKEWPKALGPQRKHLHMNRLRFKLQSERKMLERLGAIPAACGLVPILGGVRVGDYRDLLKGTPNEVIMNGYVLCMWTMLVGALIHLPKGERLEVVFEQQNIYSKYAEVAIQVFVNNPPSDVLMPDGTPKLASWRWIPKESTSLLEPADYLCYSLAKMHREPGSRKDRWASPIRVNQEGQGFGGALTREEARAGIIGGLEQKVKDVRRAMMDIP
jgi:hypothetical protein